MVRRLEYKWIVAAIFVFALFMDFLDTTVVNVALPTMARDFGVTAPTVAWVITAYLLSLAVFVPVSGWLGDRIGTKRTFLLALACFTVGSALCAAAWSIGSLIAFRALQGVGGGLLSPVGTTMLYREFPPNERARAAAVISIPTVVGPTSGPLLGGYLVEYQTWHWIFLVNVPVGILGLILAGRFLREHRERDAGGFDLPGFALAATGFAALLYALDQAGPRGLGSPRVLAFGPAGLALLAAFVAVELRTARPLIDVRLFQDRLFTASAIVLFFGQAVFVGLLFLLPLLLQSERGFSPLRAGLAAFPIAPGVAMITPLASRWYGRVGPRRLLALAMVVSALSALSFRWIDLGLGDWWIRALMVPRGWAFGLLVVPLGAVAYATIAGSQMGQATAAQNVVRQVAGSFGVALLATALSNRLAARDALLGAPATRVAAVSAFHDAFLVAVLLSLAGVVAALFVSDRLAAGTREAEPQRDAVGEVSGGRRALQPERAGD